MASAATATFFGALAAVSAPSPSPSSSQQPSSSASSSSSSSSRGGRVRLGAPGSRRREERESTCTRRLAVIARAAADRNAASDMRAAAAEYVAFGRMLGEDAQVKKPVLRAVSAPQRPPRPSSSEGSPAQAPNSAGSMAVAVTATATPDWARAEELLASQQPTRVRVLGSNSGGVLVSLGKLQGFVPASQLAPARFETLTALKRSAGKPASEEESDRMRAKVTQLRTDILSGMVGQDIEVVAVVVEPKATKLVMSERAAAGATNTPSLKDKVMAELHVGDAVRATVTSITDFGAFVSVNGVDALIHVSEIAWVRPAHPRNVLAVGDAVTAKVILLDTRTRRIGLSIRQLQPDPLLQTLDALVDGASTADMELEFDASSGVDPQEELAASESSLQEEFPELAAVCGILEQQDAIQRVMLGRRFTTSALAPDFQLFLSAPIEGGFKLLARSGRRVQEVNVSTSLTREQMKQAVQSATMKIP
eukprot:jgi/Chlat1/258/Chrsp1S03147